MSTWVIISWVAVAILTAINVAIFLKLKQASEQMLKMAFPNAKNMNEALAGLQGMMGGMQGMGGGRSPFGGMGGMPRGGAGGKDADAQLRAAMNMLQQMQQKGKKR